MLLLAGGEVLVEQAIHQQAPGAAPPQLNRPAHVHLEQPSVPIRDPREAVIDAREFGRRIGQARNAREIR